MNAGVIKIARFFQPAYQTRIHTPRLSWVPSCLQAAGALSMQSLQLYADKGVVPHPCQTICMAVKSLSFAVWLFGAKLTNHCGLADSPVGGPDKWYFLVLDYSPYYIRQHQFAWCSWHGSAFFCTAPGVLVLKALLFSWIIVASFSHTLSRYIGLSSSRCFLPRREAFKVKHLWFGQI